MDVSRPGASSLSGDQQLSKKPPHLTSQSQWKSLKWDFHFHKLDDSRWLAFEPRLGCAFKINKHARDVIESLKGCANLEEAFLKFSATRSHCTEESFAQDVGKLTDIIGSSRDTARRRLLFGITLVPHTTFSRWSCFLTGIINLPALIINILLFSIILPIAALGGASITSIGTHTTSLIAGCLALASVLVHELGHGAALRRFGHSTGGLGVGIYLIYPVFYVEMLTLDALSKRRRVWVDFSGSHAQSLFGHLIAIAGILLKAPWLTSCAIGIYAIAAFQLIPINRSDGYWMLMDSIEGSISEKHIRLLKISLQIVASMLFMGIMIVSTHSLFIKIKSGHPYLPLSMNDAIGIAQILALFIILLRLLVGRRSSRAGRVASPKVATQN